jgi:DNA modification methylase
MNNGYFAIITSILMAGLKNKGSRSLRQSQDLFDYQTFSRIPNNEKVALAKINSGIKSGKLLGAEIIGDSTWTPKILGKNTVDCVITSPPYFDIIHYGDQAKSQIGRESEKKQYIANLLKVFYPFLESLKENGTLFVNIGAKRKDKDILDLFPIAMEMIGWSKIEEITWHKTAPMPSSAPSLQPVNETIFVFSKKDSNPKPKLNPMLERTVNSGLMVSDYATRKKEHIERDPSKTLKVLDWKPAQDTWSLPNYKITRNSAKSKQLLEEIFQPSSPLAAFRLQVLRNKHPALMHPVIVRNCIWLGTKPGDVVVDPFSGTGTVTQMSKMMGRIGIGFELNLVNAMNAVIGKEIKFKGVHWDKYTLRDNSKLPKVEALDQNSPELTVPYTREYVALRTGIANLGEFSFSFTNYYEEFKANIKTEDLTNDLWEILKRV